jgi:hypothetical protein
MGEDVRKMNVMTATHSDSSESRRRTSSQIDEDQNCKDLSQGVDVAHCNTPVDVASISSQFLVGRNPTKKKTQC